MERQDLIDFVQKNGTENDKVNLSALNDFQLRTIAQRLISEKRLSCQEQIKNNPSSFKKNKK